MASNTSITLDPPVVLHLGPILNRLSDDEFFEFCALNRDWRIERTAAGDLVIMPPTGGGTGWRNSSVNAQLANWSAENGTGIAFDSSTAFRLPNGATRSPDASWLLRDRWDALSEDEQEKFPPLAPDFIVELRSRTDSLETLQEKLREYISAGVRLGWLIDPYARRIEVYRPGRESVVLDNVETLSADPELPGFTLDCRQIFA